MISSVAESLYNRQNVVVVQFEIHRAGDPTLTRSILVSMAQRFLTGVIPMDNGSWTGRCTNCDEAFMSGAPDRATANIEVQRMFDAHKCILRKEDFSQAAARIVREATERD